MIENQKESIFSQYKFPIIGTIIVLAITFFSLDIITYGFKYISAFRQDMKPQFTGNLVIKEISGLENLNGSYTLVTDRVGTWYVWGSGDTWKSSFYKIDDAKAVPIKFSKQDVYHFGNSTDVDTTKANAASYSVKNLRTLSYPNFVADKIGNKYLVYTQNDPSMTILYHLVDDVAKPIFQAPNVDTSFSADGEGNFYAFIVNAKTNIKSLYKIIGDKLEGVAQLNNAYEHNFFLNGLENNYVVTSDGSGLGYENKNQFSKYHIYKIVDNRVFEIMGVGDNLRRIRIVFGEDKNAYAVATLGDVNSNGGLQYEFYKINGNVLTKIDNLPNTKEAFSINSHLYNAIEDQEKTPIVNSKNYSVETLSGEPFWKCRVSFNDGKENIPVKNIKLNTVSCHGLYTNGGNKTFVINAGDILGQIKTKAYWLYKDEAFYIPNFEDMRALEFAYDKTRDVWYGRTIVDGGKSHVYQISFPDTQK